MNTLSSQSRIVAVLGSINMDLSATVSRIPHSGETVAGFSFGESPGGKGANQALAARRAGASVFMHGAVGRDDWGSKAIARLLEDGVDIAGVRQVKGNTGVALVFVDPRGENAIAFVSGANSDLAEDDAARTLANLKRGDVLLLQQEIPVAATSKALGLANAKGVISILNTAPLLDATAVLAKEASIVVANESEFELLTQGDDEGDLMTKIANRARRLKQTVVVTLGPRGVMAASPTETFSLPALAIEPLDTVGAGDTFCGYLAASLAGHQSLSSALSAATIAASLACLKKGAQSAVPYKVDVDAWVSD